MDFSAAYHTLKQHVAGATGGGHAILHVDAGLAIYLLFQLAMGTRRGSLAALAVLVHLVICDELMNRLYFGGWRVRDSLGDMALTLLWPTLLLSVSIFRRWRWRVTQPRVRPKVTLKLVPAPDPGKHARAIMSPPPRQPPRLRVFPGYAGPEAGLNRPRSQH